MTQDQGSTPEFEYNVARAMSFQEPEAVAVEEPSLLVRISRLYEPGMSPQALYDTTRGVWVLSARRAMARYALAIFHGVVLEVYSIEEWHRAGTTQYATRVIDVSRYGNRWEFTGEPALEEIRSRYVGKSVAAYFKRGNASPVMYVNC